MTFITLLQSGSIIDLDSVSFVTRIQSKTAGRGIRIKIIVGWIVLLVTCEPVSLLGNGIESAIASSGFAEGWRSL